MRKIFSLLIALALLAILASPVAAQTRPAPNGTTGVSTWAGNYRMIHVSPAVHNPTLSIETTYGDYYLAVYCGALSGQHYPPTPNDQYAWTAAFGTNTVYYPTMIFPIYCGDVSDLLIVTGPAPTVQDANVVPANQPPPR
jgi:hypothetical protein